MAPAARLPRTFWFLFAGALLNRVGSFVIPLFSIYLTGPRALPPLTAGWVISAYGLGSLLSGPLGGTLADRLGRRPTLIGGFVWSAGAMLLVPLAEGPIALALASLHLGLSTDLYRPAMQAAVADLCPPAQRTRAYGLLYWAVNLGFACAAALGGLLARHGFQRLFVIDAATTLAFALLIAIFVPETRPPIAARDREASGTWSAALSDGVLTSVLGIQCLVGVLYLQAHGALPVALGMRGIGPALYGRIVAVNGLLIVVLQPLGMWAVARMRRTRALALGALLVGIGFGLNAPALGVAGAVVSVAVWTLGEIVGSPVLPALLSDLAPDHLRGRYQGMGQMSFGVCALVGPPLGMWTLQHHSVEALWIGSAVVGVTAAVLHLGRAPALRARLGDKGRPA